MANALIYTYEIHKKERASFWIFAIDFLLLSKYQKGAGLFGFNLMPAKIYKIK